MRTFVIEAAWFNGRFWRQCAPRREKAGAEHVAVARVMRALRVQEIKGRRVEQWQISVRRLRCENGGGE